MNTFEKLLEIKTWKKDFLIKAVYIENSITGIQWSYYIYYYDIETNTFYINDLDNLDHTHRASTTNIIEHIISKAYYQELHSTNNVLKIILKNKKPKVYNIYNNHNWVVVIDKINLKAIKSKNENIIWFKSPKWNINDSDDMKIKKLYTNLLDLYNKKY